MNLDPEDPVGARNRAMLFGLATLVAVGIIVGLSVGWLGSRAVDSTGIDDVQAPPGRSQVGDDPVDDFTAGQTEPTETTPTETTAPTTPTPTEPTKPNKTRKPHEATLVAAPSTADSSERISLSGRFPDLPEGAPLYVERREGGVWTPFADVIATTDERGMYSTWIWTGQDGRNLFRLTSESGESTPPVVIQIT